MGSLLVVTGPPGAGKSSVVRVLADVAHGPRPPRLRDPASVPLEVCVQRVARRRDHGFTDEAATRKMHGEFARARVDDRHMLRAQAGDAAAVAELIASASEAGKLTYAIR